jgi:uncharacterized protein
VTDARPLRLGVAELLAHPGERRHRELSVVLADLTLAIVGVDAGDAVEVDLVLEGVPDGVTAVGTVGFGWVGQCRRCVSPVAGQAEVSFREIFATSGDDPDVRPLDEDHVDMEPTVREAVLLGLPLAPLCGEACLGPDPEHFPTDGVDRRNAEEAEGGSPSRDPRWAGLDALTFDDDAP